MKKYILGLSVLTLLVFVGFGAQKAFAAAKCSVAADCPGATDKCWYGSCVATMTVGGGVLNSIDNASVVAKDSNATNLQLRTALQALVDANKFDIATRSDYQTPVAGQKTVAGTPDVTATSYELAIYDVQGNYKLSIHDLQTPKVTLNNINYPGLQAGDKFATRWYVNNKLGKSPAGALTVLTADAVAGGKSATSVDAKNFASCDAQLKAVYQGFSFLNRIIKDPTAGPKY